jgi:hypothetical protein
MLKRMPNHHLIEDDRLQWPSSDLEHDLPAGMRRMRALVKRVEERRQNDLDEIDRLRQENAALRAEIAYWRERAIGDRAAAEHFESLLRAVYGSTTWRALGPLRRLGRKAPGAARIVRWVTRAAYRLATLQLPRRGDRAVELVSPSAATAPAPAALAPPALQPLDQLTRRIFVLESRLDYERGRVDHALAGLEGVHQEMDDFHAARVTPEYQAAFDAREPLVTVCVATMNRPGLLIDRCLKSLQNQSYRNLQILVVGDHCTDDTGYQVARLGDSRITFHNLQCRGPYPRESADRWLVAGSNAMNFALAHAKGAFVTHLDDDDFATYDRVATMLAAAQCARADLCWHALWHERPDGTWYVLGNGKLELGQVSTNSLFYHRYHARIGWDVKAYRLQEPGDWNRIRRIKALRPRTHWVDHPLVYHFKEQNQPNLVPQHAETFLE